MTTKIISTIYSSGYTLAATYSGLDITNTGAVDGKGLTLSATASVVTNGNISGSAAGLTADGGLTLVNGANSVGISGYSVGVNATNAATTVTNFGGILGRGSKGFGVELEDGGTVTNGAATITSASIIGYLTGVEAAGAAKLVNFGRIDGYQGDAVYLEAGGSLTNGSSSDFQATIYGDTAVASGSTPIAIANFHLIKADGTASAAITLNGGGEVTNGAASDTLARIYGYHAGIHSVAVATVANFGTVIAENQRAVSLDNGGLVVNGTTADTRALIEGATQGVYFTAGLATLRNFGTIQATTKGSGVAFESGVVTNGSTLATNALIDGFYRGVMATGAGAVINNFGIIDGSGGGGPTSVYGVFLQVGGSVTNGAANDTTATIEGGDIGVVTESAAKVVNFGTILGSQEAVVINGGGSLVNGSTADTKALIFGFLGASITGGVGTVSNLGSVISYGTEAGVGLFNSGTVTNGAASDTHALIEGGSEGVAVSGAAEVVNFGTIESVEPGINRQGVIISSGTVTNGSVTNKTALISGDYGIAVVSGAATVTNFGTIRGTGGTALSFAASGSVLNVEAGSAFQGVVVGGGGTLNLANGTGVLSGMDSYGNVTVSGSMAAATFGDFATLKIAVGATFTDTGVVSIGTGHSVIDAGVLRLSGATTSVVNAGTIEATGSLTLAGAVRNSGLLEVAGGVMTVSGTVTLGGSVTINKGVATFASAFTENVAFTANGGTLALGRSRTYTGSISGFSKTPLSILDLEDIAFKSGTTKASYSGTTTSGTLTVTNGALTSHIKLLGNYLSSTFTVASDGHGGTKVTDPPAAAPSGAPGALVAAMAALSPAGAAIEVHEGWRGHVAGPTALLAHPA